MGLNSALKLDIGQWGEGNGTPEVLHNICNSEQRKQYQAVGITMTITMVSIGTKISQNNKNNNDDDSNKHWNQDQVRGNTLPFKTCP